MRTSEYRHSGISASLHIASVLLVSLMAHVSSGAAAAARYDGVRDPPAQARPFVRRWGRHRYDGREALRRGQNILEFKVTTTLLNYCQLLEVNPTAVRWTIGKEFVAAGRGGPRPAVQGPAN